MGSARGMRQPEPLCALAANLAGEPEQPLLDEGGKGDLRWEQGRDRLMELGQAWFWAGLSRDCQLFPTTITILLDSLVFH